MSNQPRENWHTMSASDVAKRLKTDVNRGLEPKICRSRLRRIGRNELFLPERGRLSSCFRALFGDPSLLVLLFLCFVALAFRRYEAAWTVLTVLMASLCVSLVAYYKSMRIKETMSSYSVPRVRVVRGGKLMVTDAANIVPGDLLLLQRGDIVPADVRLVGQSEDFGVLTFVFEAGGDEKYVPATKNATLTYDNYYDIPVYDRMNMMYAGTIVHTGHARAIVTETGADTYIATQAGEHCLATRTGDPGFTAPIRRQMNRHGLLLTALLLPVTLIAILTGLGRVSVFDILLILLALVVSAMSEQVVAMGHLICACGVIRASVGTPRENSAMIKNYRAIDAMGHIDELFLFDKTALSDGKFHPYAVYADGAMCSGDKLKNDAVEALFELACFYDMALRESGDWSLRSEYGKMSQGVRELGEFLRADFAALRIRLQSSAIRRKTAFGPCVELTLRRTREGRNNGSFALLCTTDVGVLTQCNCYRKNDELLSLREEGRQTLAEIFRHLHDQGTHVVILVRYEGDAVIFEGMIAYREAYHKNPIQLRKRLENTHMRLSLFLPEESAYQLSCLSAAGWVTSEEDVSRASDGNPLSGEFEKKRVFLGYPEEEIVALMTAYRQAGKVTACLGLRHGEAPMMSPADVCISCESGSYRTDASVKSEIEVVTEADGSEDQCDQTVRYNADVLIRRATRNGGGLAGILNMVYTARSVSFRMMLAAQYLVITQALRLTVVVLPLLFGAMPLSPMFALISGLWVDLGYILVCAFHHCNADVLDEVPDYRTFFAAPLRARPDWGVAAVACGIVLLVIGKILAACGIAPYDGRQQMYMMLSIFFAQTTLLFCLLRTAGAFSRRLSAHLSSLTIFAVTFLSVALVVLIPPLAGAFGGKWSLACFALSLLSPAFLVGGYFLSRRYRLPVRKKLRRLLRRLCKRIGNIR